MKVNFILLITFLSFSSSFSQNLLSKHEVKAEQFGRNIFYKDKDGNLLNGECKISDKTGNYVDATFVNGKKEGKTIDYNFEGNITKIAYYSNGIPVGEYKKYYWNGELRTTGKYIDGEKDGKWETFSNTGKPSTIEYYIKGKKTGKWEIFDRKGEIKTIEHYLNDLKTGKWWTKQYASHKKGYIYITKNYKKGVITGYSDEKHEDGTLYWERDYKDYENYTHKAYHPNGKLSLIRHVKNSKWDGEFIKYDENGTITSKELYDYGKIVKPSNNTSIEKETGYKTLNTSKTNKGYEPPVEVTKTKTRAINKTVSEFNYKALLISNENYQNDVADLEFPTNDAKKLIDVLSKKYNFLEKDIIHLKDATRSNIINTLDSLATTITPNDNLLIFYAGHGFYDENLSKGYWIPVNATTNKKDFWVSNGDIRDYITAIKSQHTLLVSDACFSGSIFDFKHRGLKNNNEIITEKLLNKKSRKAMTSGLNKTVPDKSIFIKYLIKYLDENKKSYLRAGELYNDIRDAVMANTDNNPQFEVIKNSNHEGGEFIFHKKD